jgi:signal transduction histidine kinase
MLTEDLAELPAAHQTAVKIAGGVRRLDEIVTDVLSFARETRLNRERIAAEELLTQASECCGPWGDGAVSIDAGGVELFCDAGLLQQALTNLVRNARDAIESAEGGGVVRLSARRFACDGRAMQSVSVCDDGPGIPAEVIDRMFNPFFTTRAAGTGLGLAIVHRIVDAHGGRVEVSNNAGRGATVELRFPVPADGAGAVVSVHSSTTGPREAGFQQRTESLA